MLNLLIGTYDHNRQMRFLVSDGFEGFGFLGFESPQECGMVIDTGGLRLLVQQHAINFWSSKVELSRCAAFGSAEVDERRRVRVELSIPTMLPPNGNIITMGKLIFPDEVEKVTGQYLLDPVMLKRNYGLLAPRCIVQVGEDWTVPVLVKNLYRKV